MESNAKAYSTVRLILFLNISLSKRVTFAQVSEGKRLIGSEAPTPLLNFFAEDLPQSWTLALPIEIGFKRAVKLWWFTKEREFVSILRQTTQMQFLPLHLQPPCACFRPIQKQNHRGGEGLPEGSRLDSIVVSVFVGILVKRQEDLSFPVLKQGRWYYVTRIVSCFATLLSAEVVAVHRRG